MEHHLCYFYTVPKFKRSLFFVVSHVVFPLKPEKKPACGKTGRPDLCSSKNYRINFSKFFSLGSLGNRFVA